MSLSNGGTLGLEGLQYLSKDFLDWVVFEVPASMFFVTLKNKWNYFSTLVATFTQQPLNE